MVYFLTNNLENNIGGIMADNNEKQALFMEALNSLKEYAKVNCGVVTKDDVRSYFKERVYDTIIPRLVKLSEAPSHGKPIHIYDKDSKGTLAYLNLAKEVIERNGN